MMRKKERQLYLLMHFFVFFFVVVFLKLTVRYGTFLSILIILETICMKINLSNLFQVVRSVVVLVQLFIVKNA